MTPTNTAANFRAYLTRHYFRECLQTVKNKKVSILKTMWTYFIRLSKEYFINQNNDFFLLSVNYTYPHNYFNCIILLYSSDVKQLITNLCLLTILICILCFFRSPVQSTGNILVLFCSC